MIVRDPSDVSYQIDQERIEANDRAKIEHAISPIDWDSIKLKQMVADHGIELVLATLQNIQAELNPNITLEYRLLSRAYRSGHYDDPNPHVDSEF